MSLQTPLTDLLGIRHPIIQAPMAFGAGGALAAAVTRGGGLGLIGGGYGEQDWLEEQYQAAGNARFGVGFITWSLARQPQLLDGALARQPAAIMLSFGDPTPFAGAIKDAGALLICQVQTLADALVARDAGADLIVAQGGEAGGHAGKRATISLVPAVVDAVAPIPVVAAGGIADGRGLAAALVLGACGVLMGTRFYATPEFLGHDKAKAQVVEASGDATVQSRVVDMVRGKDWPRRFANRTLTNDFTDRWAADEDALAADLATAAQEYDAAARAGDFDTAAVIAGEGVDLVRDIVPADELVERIAAEAEAALAGKGWTS
jgi:nitronate monooxygenase